jgi:hypothetical protein
VDKILQQLTDQAKEDAQQTANDNGRKNSWISESTWQLIDQKASARRSGNISQAKNIAKELRRSLNKDRKCRMDKVAEEIESYLTANSPKEAFHKLQNWYKERSGRPPKPTLGDAEATRKEYEKLFGAEHPPGEDIPIHISPTPHVNDDPPSEKEIIEALKRIRLGKAPGATGIRIEHLRKWMAGATKAKDPTYVGEWAMVIKLVEMAFTGEEIPSAFVVGILVLLPKPDGDFRGIALLEVLYKLISSIINRRLANTLNTRFHDGIHGFRESRGTGTATIEAKLLMQLAARTNKPLHMIFMDLKKAYDTLDRDRTMKILEGYGVGANVRRIIREIWNGDTMVTKQSGFSENLFAQQEGFARVTSCPLLSSISSAMLSYENGNRK